jgi:hypothetical protein
VVEDQAATVFIFVLGNAPCPAAAASLTRKLSPMARFMPLRLSAMLGQCGRCRRCDQALMSVCPSDPEASTHLALDDFSNFALARQGADLR